MLSLSLTEGKNTVRDFIVEVHHDEHAESPLTDCEFLGTMVCFHGRYNLGHKDGLDNLLSCIWSSAKFDDRWDIDKETPPPQLQEYAEKCGFLVRPLYLYDHSGLTISMAEFSCPWDSGQVGFVFVTPERIAEEYPDEVSWDKPIETLESEIKLYDMYLTGEVYGYVIKDLRGNEVDSCWGFFGEEGLTAAVEETISYLEKNPPFTALSELEERMVNHILELETQLAFEQGEVSGEQDEDGHDIPLDKRAFIEDVEAKFGIRINPEKVS